VRGSGAGSRETFERGSKAARLEPCATSGASARSLWSTSKGRGTAWRC